MVVRPRSWKELDSWNVGDGLFSVLFNIFVTVHILNSVNMIVI